MSSMETCYEKACVMHFGTPTHQTHKHTGTTFACIKFTLALSYSAALKSKCTEVPFTMKLPNGIRHDYYPFLSVVSLRKLLFSSESTLQNPSK